MNREEIKKELVGQIIKELNIENKNRIYYNKKTLDVCFMVSVIEQQIHNCKQLIDDLTQHNFYVNGYDEDITEGYTNGKLRILIEKPNDEKESEYMVDVYYDYIYEIEFEFDERYWGYCQCSQEDEGYDLIHKCCGNGCDWTAPKFSVHKVDTLGSYSWNGVERDFWKYEKKFHEDINNKNIEVERYEKEQSLQYINQQIKELLNKKASLENELKAV